MLSRFRLFAAYDIPCDYKSLSAGQTLSDLTSKQQFPGIGRIMKRSCLGCAANGPMTEAGI